MSKFEYDLDRKVLETIYISFKRPVLEYADVIWDNCTQQEKRDLEKIQTEAARIETGTTKLVSLQKTVWRNRVGNIRSQKEKNINSCCFFFYKMLHNLSPLYLSSLVPPQVQNVSRYNLRNANNVQTLVSHTSQHFQSFLPSVIRDWNDLSDDTRNADTVESFKRKIHENTVVIPKYYYTGRQLQILHTRIRVGCSALNNDLFFSKEHSWKSIVCLQKRRYRKRGQFLSKVYA